MQQETIRRNMRVADNCLADGRGVLLHLETGSYHGLNTVGWAVWDLIDGRRTEAQIVEELRRRIEDAPPELQDEISRFLEGLRARDLIE